LLAKRDPKLQKKINKMLKTIKSANKSVLEDAVDHQNTAITLAGPQQCDDDDYGYVSQESSALYAQIMQKYTSQPEEKKFPDARGKPADISSTKARVRDALNRAQEEENAPHQRKPRQSKGPRSATSEPEPYVGWGDRNKVDVKVQQEKPKKKNRPPPPPALDFQQLLALAAQKQHEPIQVEAPVVKKEPERLLTKKQREELEERKALAEAKAARMKGGPVPGQKKPTSTTMPPPKTTKVSKTSRDPPPSNATTIPKATSTDRIPLKSSSSSKPLPSSSGASKARPVVPAKSSTDSPRLMSALTDASRSKPSQPAASTRPAAKPSNVPTKTREFPPSAGRSTDKARPDTRKEAAPARPHASDNGKTRPFPPPDHRFRDQRPPQKKVPKKRKLLASISGFLELQTFD
jgi:protein SPT2